MTEQDEALNWPTNIFSWTLQHLPKKEFENKLINYVLSIIIAFYILKAPSKQK